MIFNKSRKFCKQCVFVGKMKESNNVDSLSIPYCRLCSTKKEQITPYEHRNWIDNGGCYLELNKNNDCSFYTTKEISDEKFQQLRTACKLKMAK